MALPAVVTTQRRAIPAHSFLFARILLVTVIEMASRPEGTVFLLY